jgi:hypothetical protein
MRIRIHNPGIQEKQMPHPSFQKHSLQYKQPQNVREFIERQRDPRFCFVRGIVRFAKMAGTPTYKKITSAQPMSTRCLPQLGVLPFIFFGRFTISIHM